MNQSQQRRLELDDMRWLLSDRQGRRIIWRYLSAWGVFRTSCTGDNWTFFNEGQRNAGLRLLADLNEAHPEAYTLMLRESQEDAKNGGSNAKPTDADADE